MNSRKQILFVAMIAQFVLIASAEASKLNCEETAKSAASASYARYFLPIKDLKAVAKFAIKDLKDKPWYKKLFTIQPSAHDWTVTITGDSAVASLPPQKGGDSINTGEPYSVDAMNVPLSMGYGSQGVSQSDGTIEYIYWHPGFYLVKSTGQMNGVSYDYNDQFSYRMHVWVDQEEGRVVRIELYEIPANPKYTNPLNALDMRNHPLGAIVFEKNGITTHASSKPQRSDRR